MKTLCFVFRKKNPLFFSIEKVFEPLINNTIVSGWKAIAITVPHYSTGIPALFRNIFYLRKVKSDIFHITGDIHYAVFAFPRNKTILTIHDCVFIRQHKGFKRWLMNCLFLKWPVHYSAYVTTISEQSKFDIVKYSGCDPDKITVIPDPVSAHIRFSPKEFNSTQPVILFIGSTPNKNLDRVLEALKGISCILEIVGKVDDEKKRKMEQAGIRYRISANLTEEQLNAKYTEADLVLFPSLFEGFGLPIIEAQQAGRVVITSNKSPMSEVAGTAACLVNPLDAISIREAVVRVIGDEEYRANLIKAGFENIRKYGSSAISEEYGLLYKKLISVSP